MTRTLLRTRSLVALALVAALASSCVEELDRDEIVIMDVLMLGVGATGKPVARDVVAAPARAKLTAELPIASTVTIGGLSGTYDVTLGSYGRFTGSATVVGRRAAKLTVEGSAELAAAVQAILADALATDVTVSSAKAKITGRQTTGGVKKKYKGKIKWSGTVAAGPDAGTAVKGKLSAKGDLED